MRRASFERPKAAAEAVIVRLNDEISIDSDMEDSALRRELENLLAPLLVLRPSINTCGCGSNNGKAVLEREPFTAGDSNPALETARPNARLFRAFRIAMRE
jgi:hypothetical protein